jgi:hypothetical protein
MVLNGHSTRTDVCPLLGLQRTKDGLGAEWVGRECKADILAPVRLGTA